MRKLQTENNIVQKSLKRSGISPEEVRLLAAQTCINLSLSRNPRRKMPNWVQSSRRQSAIETSNPETCLEDPGGWQIYIHSATYAKEEAESFLASTNSVMPKSLTCLSWMSKPPQWTAWKVGIIQLLGKKNAEEYPMQPTIRIPPHNSYMFGQSKECRD